MPSLVYPFGELIFLNIDLLADGMAVAASDDIELGGAEGKFHRGAVIFGIVGVGIGIVESVINIQPFDFR